MELGMIGSGRMGANMVRRRLLRAGHQCVVYDTREDPVEKPVREGGPGDLCRFAISWTR